MPPADAPEAFLPADPPSTDKQAGADGSADGEADATARWSCSAPPRGGMPQPFLEWLAANGVDLNTITAWPVIEFDCPQPGMMRIEALFKVPGRDYSGRAGMQPTKFWQEIGTTMLTVPMPVPMSEQLRTAWDHMAPLHRAARDTKQLMAMLSQGATVLTVDQSDLVTFVTTQNIGKEGCETLMDQIRRMFPHIRVSVLTGVSGVMVTGLDGEHRHEPERLRKKDPWT